MRTLLTKQERRIVNALRDGYTLVSLDVPSSRRARTYTLRAVGSAFVYAGGLWYSGTRVIARTIDRLRSKGVLDQQLQLTPPYRERDA